MRKVSVAERLRHQERDAQDQLALRKILGRPLMRRMSRSVRLKRSAIHQINVAQKKHTLPRHHHVVEKDDTVHLLEAGAERMVEVGTSQVEAFAAQKSEPRPPASHSEPSCQGPMPFRHPTQPT